MGGVFYTEEQAAIQIYYMVGTQLAGQYRQQSKGMKVLQSRWSSWVIGYLVKQIEIVFLFMILKMILLRWRGGECFPSTKSFLNLVD